MLGEQGVYLGLYGGDPLELHVQRRFHAKQQFFVPIEAFDDWFHDGFHDRWNQRFERRKDRLGWFRAGAPLRGQGRSVSRSAQHLNCGV
jgi:hypothetical protein